MEVMLTIILMSWAFVAGAKVQERINPPCAGTVKVTRGPAYDPALGPVWAQH